MLNAPCLCTNSDRATERALLIHADEKQSRQVCGNCGLQIGAPLILYEWDFDGQQSGRGVDFDTGSHENNEDDKVER